MSSATRAVERGGEVDFAIHRATGDLGDLRPKPEEIGQLVEHLVLDDRRLQIGDEHPLAPPGGRLHENIDRGAARSAAPSSRRAAAIGRVEDEIAGLARGEPVRLGPTPKAAAIATARGGGRRGRAAS